MHVAPATATTETNWGRAARSMKPLYGLLPEGVVGGRRMKGNSYGVFADLAAVMGGTGTRIPQPLRSDVPGG